MRPLKLMNLFMAPYRGTFVDNVFKETAVNAYIYETMKDRNQDQAACDANGAPIGTFMSHDARIALEEHVRTVISPLIQQKLQSSCYRVTGVDYTNQAPHPHLVIERKDAKPLSEDDVKCIQMLVELSILTINRQKSSAAVLPANTIFKPAAHPATAVTNEKNKPTITVMEAAETETKHHYNLRPRH
tara:strand:- start:251 stop:811 length:561 start_codon:yes stop_codon:yes gene_type:complete